MEKKTKYMILVLEERNGEYEYYHRSVHELPDVRTTTMKKCAEKYLKGFYGGNEIKEKSGYYFHDGEIYVRINSYKIISQEEYNVLNQYL